MPKVEVALGERSYDVHVGAGLVSRLTRLLGGLRGRSLALVSNPTVFALHGEAVERELGRLGARVVRVLIPDGEVHKTVRTWQRVTDELVRARLPRDGALVALGGGVVGDLTGFVAATYQRGIDFVQIPTTLLAMVDSSVGGKVAVNHPAGKNLIGAFHQPSAVVADLALLSTLPSREFQSGAYELLKTGLLGDAALARRVARHGGRCETWTAAALAAAVAAAVRIKADVVARDEREGGLRRVLNLGHTLGHALEAVTRYRRFTHGEAVGWGLLAVTRISASRGLLAPRLVEQIEGAVHALGPRPRIGDLPFARVMEALGHDKKARAGRVPFILPNGLGSVSIVDDVTEAELRAVWGHLAG